jgi:hypothetical protein
MNSCTVVLIHHESANSDLEAQGSVCLFAGDARQTIRTTNIQQLQESARIVGPIDLNIAAIAANHLQQFFERNGITVFSEAYAD